MLNHLASCGEWTYTKGTPDCFKMSDVCKQLMVGSPGSVYFIDRRFSGIPVLDQATRRGLGVVGHVKINKKHLCHQILQSPYYQGILNMSPRGAWFQFILKQDVSCGECGPPLVIEDNGETTELDGDPWPYTLTGFKEKAAEWTWFIDNCVRTDLLGEAWRDYTNSGRKQLRAVPLVVQLYNDHAGSVDQCNKARAQTMIDI